MDHTPAHESAHKVQNTCTVTGESYRNFSSGILKRLRDVERQAAEGSVQCATSSSLYACAADNIPPSSTDDSGMTQSQSTTTTNYHPLTFTRSRMDDRFSVNAMMDALGESTHTSRRITTPRKLDVSNISTIACVNDDSNYFGGERSPTIYFEGVDRHEDQQESGHCSPFSTTNTSRGLIPGSTAVTNWKLSSSRQLNQQQENSSTFTHNNFETSTIVTSQQNSLIHSASEYLRNIRTAHLTNVDGSMTPLDSPPLSPDRRQTSVFFEYSETTNSQEENKDKEGTKVKQTNSESVSASQSPLLPKKKLPEVHPDILEARQLIAAAKERYHLYSTTTQARPPPKIDIMVTSPTPIRGGSAAPGKKIMPRGRKGVVPAASSPPTMAALRMRNPALQQPTSTTEGLKEKQLEETANSSPQTTQVKDLYFSGGQCFLKLKKCAEVSAGMTFSPERRRSMGGSDDWDSDIDEMMEEITRSSNTTSSAIHNRQQKLPSSYEAVPFFKGFSVPSTRKGLQQHSFKSENSNNVTSSDETSESTEHKLDRMRPPKLEGLGFGTSGVPTAPSLPGGGGADALKQRAPSRDSDKERELLLEIENQNAEREKQQENEAREIIRQARETAATQLGVAHRLLPSYLDDNGFMFDDPFAGDNNNTLQLPPAQASLPLQVPSVQYPLTMTWPQAASHPDRLLLIDSGVYQQASKATLIHHWKSRRIAIVGKRMYVFRHPSTKKELQCEIDEQVAQEAADRQEESGYHRQVAAASSPHSAASIQHPGISNLSPNSKLYNRSVFSVGVDCLSGEVPKGNYLGKKCVVVFRYSHPKPPAPNGPEERIQLLVKHADTTAATFYTSILASSAASSAVSGSRITKGGLLSPRSGDGGSSSPKKNPSEISVVLSFTIPEHLKEIITVVYTAASRAKSLRDCAVQHLLSGKQPPSSTTAKPGGLASSVSDKVAPTPQEVAVRRARLQAANELSVSPTMIANYFEDNGVLASGEGSTSSGNGAPYTLLWKDASDHPHKALVVESGVFLQTVNSNILHHWKSRRIAIVGKRLYVFRNPESEKERRIEKNEMNTSTNEEKHFSRSVFSVGVERLTGEIAGGSYLGKSFVSAFHYTPPSLFEKDPLQLETKQPQHQGSPVRLASPKRLQSPAAGSVITLAFGNADDLKNTITSIVAISTFSKKLKARAVEILSLDPSVLQAASKPSEDASSPARRRRGVSFAAPK